MRVDRVHSTRVLRSVIGCTTLPTVGSSQLPVLEHVPEEQDGENAAHQAIVHPHVSGS